MKRNIKTSIVSVLLATLICFFSGCSTPNNSSQDSSSINSFYSYNDSLVESVSESSSVIEQSSEQKQIGSGAANPAQTTLLPNYSGQPYIQLNNNVPNFSDSELTTIGYEKYSNLDNLGRCGVAIASCGKEIMPESGEKRESISSIKPSGWIQSEYDNISGKYLYNRCHLIGWQLSAENANKMNLITGTKYLNISGMLPFENMVADYIKETNNHVAYRVTPIYEGNNLVASGVQMEAYSIEDNGEGISFNVYCYNVQPDININYATGASSYAGASTISSVESIPSVKSSSSEVQSTNPNNTQNQITQQTGQTVYRTPTGKRYHFSSTCGGKNSYEVTLDQAKQSGLTPCQKCAQ